MIINTFLFLRHYTFIKNLFDYNWWLSSVFVTSYNSMRNCIYGVVVDGGTKNAFYKFIHFVFYKRRLFRFCGKIVASYVFVFVLYRKFYASGVLFICLMANFIALHKHDKTGDNFKLWVLSSNNHVKGVTTNYKKQKFDLWETLHWIKRHLVTYLLLFLLYFTIYVGRQILQDLKKSKWSPFFIFCWFNVIIYFDTPCWVL